MVLDIEVYLMRFLKKLKLSYYGTKVYFLQFISSRVLYTFEEYEKIHFFIIYELKIILSKY